MTFGSKFYILDFYIIKEAGYRGYAKTAKCLFIPEFGQTVFEFPIMNSIAIIIFTLTVRLVSTIFFQLLF